MAFYINQNDARDKAVALKKKKQPEVEQISSMSNKPQQKQAVVGNISPSVNDELAAGMARLKAEAAKAKANEILAQLSRTSPEQLSQLAGSGQLSKLLQPPGIMDQLSHTVGEHPLLALGGAGLAGAGGMALFKKLLGSSKPQQKQAAQIQPNNNQAMLDQDTIYKLAFFDGFCKEAKIAGLSQAEANELFKVAGPLDALTQGAPGAGGPEEAAEGQNEQMSEEDEARLIELLLAEAQKGGGLPPGVDVPPQAQDQQIDPQELAALIQAFQADHAGNAGAPPAPQGMA